MTTGGIPGVSQDTTSLLDELRRKLKAQTQPILFKQDEAKLYGYSLDTGWQLKGYLEGEQVRFSLLSPEQWEIRDNDIIISPFGQEYTREQLENEQALRERALRLAQVGLEEPGLPQTTETQQPVVTASLEEQYSQDLQKLFAAVFPASSQDINSVISQMSTNPEDFISAIQQKGQTPQTEALLQSIYPEATPDEINEVYFGIDEAERQRRLLVENELSVRSAEAAWREIYAAHGFYTDEEIEVFVAAKLGGYFDDEAVKEFWYTPPTEQGIKDWYTKYRGMEPVGEQITKYLKMRTGGEEPMGLSEMALNSLALGTASLYDAISGGLSWLGIDTPDFLGDVSENIKTFYKQPETELGEFDFGDILKPEFWATTVTGSLPYMVALMPLAMAGGALAGGVAAAAGVGQVGAWIAGSIGSVALSRPIESFLEAGNSYQAALNKGMTPEEASAAAGQTFQNNLILAGSDLLEIGIALMPMPSALKAIKNPFIQTARVAGKVVIVGLTEAGEEAYQDVIQRNALGEEVKLDAQMMETMAVGFIYGGVLGFGGDVISSVIDKARAMLRPEAAAALDATIDAAKAEGRSDGLADMQGLEAAISTQEDAEAVIRAINEVNQDLKGNIPSMPELISQQEAIIRATSSEMGRQISELMEKTGWSKGKFNAISAELFKEIVGTEPSPSMLTADMKNVRGPEAVKAIARQFGYGSANELRAAIGNIAQAKARGGAINWKLSGEPAPQAIARDIYMAQSEIEGLREYLQSERGAKLTKLLKKTGWYKGELRDLTLKQYRDLTGKREILPNIRTADKKHVRWEYSLDEIATEYGYKTGDELKDAIEHFGEIRERINRLEAEARRLAEVAPSEPSVKAIAIPLGVMEASKLSRSEVEMTLQLFTDALNSEELALQRAATLELRKRVQARRAAGAGARAEQLIVEGMSAEEAVKQANKEILSGKLPTVDSEFMVEFSDEMRSVLMAKVYDYWTRVEPNYYELVSTMTALSNALRNGNIPRNVGTGSSAFPNGGSAYLRLQRVFGGQLPVLEALNQGKVFEDVVEGIFHEVGREPVPIDQQTADYLRSLSDQTVARPLDMTEGNIRDYLMKQYQQEQQRLKRALKSAQIGRQEYARQMNQARNQVVAHFKDMGLGETMPLLPTPLKDMMRQALKEILWSPVDIGNFLRANKASFDMSFWRQQKFLIPQDVTGFVIANIMAWRALWSQKTADAVEVLIRHHPLYIFYEKAEKLGYDFLRPPELKPGTKQWRGIEEFGYLTGERLIPRLTMKIPWVKLSQRAYTTGTNWHNWSIFVKWYEATMRYNEKIASGEVSPPKNWSIERQMMDCARLLSDWSGRASLGRLAPAAPVLSAGVFAPRKFLGDLLTPRHLLSSNPRIRRVAWKNMTLVVSIIGGLVILGKELDWWDTELDPRSADFMKIRTGNTRIDPWGGKQQIAVFCARVAETIFGDSKGISSITGQEYELDPVGLITNFIRNKASPLANVISDFWTGKNFVGEDVEIANPKQWLERMAPFMIWDVYEAYQENEALGLGLILPAIVGEGIQTYTGERKDNWQKLGYPKYSENLPFNLEEPRYTTADFWADHAGDFKDADPAELTEKKGYPPYIALVALCQQHLAEIADLPSQKPISLNADPDEGLTYSDYYLMWQQRQALVDAGDDAEFITQELQENGKYKQVIYHGDEAVEAFDNDERYEHANYGNFSKRVLDLLNQYYALPEDERKAFAGNHPELSFSPRNDWLVAHPLENAQLAIFGKAKILTQEAYEAFKNLLIEYDIPDNALPEQTLPPDASVENFFQREEAVDQYGAMSAESLLILATDDTLRDWYGFSQPPQPARYYEIKIDTRTEREYWQELSDKDSAIYVEDMDARRGSFYEEFPGSSYFADEARCEALSHGFTDEQVEKWAAREAIVIEHGALSPQDKLFLMDNMETYRRALDEGLLNDRGGLPTAGERGHYVQWNYEATVLRVENTEEMDYYEGVLSNKDNPGYVKDIDERWAELERQFPGNTLRDDLNRIEAFNAGFTKEEAELWAQRGDVAQEYGPLSANVKVWLLEHPEIMQKAIDVGLISPDYSSWNYPALKIRSEFADDFAWYYDGIREKHQNIGYASEKLMDEAIADERADYLENNADFREAMIKEKAFSESDLPAGMAPQYVEYYSLSEKGYRRERYLVEHPDFAEALNHISGIEIPDASKIPPVRYDEIYDTYRVQFERLDGLNDPKSEYYIADDARREKARDALRYNADGTFTMFGAAEKRREAYGLFVPEQFVENYVEYAQVYAIGKSEGQSLWYDDDWYLIEHPEYYNQIYVKLLGHQRRDFTKVPSRAVFALWQVYDGLPTGQPRYDFRARYPLLDDWLVTAFDMKPVGDRGNADAPPTPWELSEEAQRLLEMITGGQWP